MSTEPMIVRLDAAGNQVMSFDLASEPDVWLGLALDGDGTFLVGNFISSNVFRFDLNGDVLNQFNTGAPAGTVKDIEVVPAVEALPPPDVVGKGCTPGYWKNHPGAWPPTGFSPEQSAASVFAAAAGYPEGSATLMQALNFGGGPGVRGGVRILCRAAVAAVLNAAHPDVGYPRSAAEVIGEVDAALASADRATMITLAEQLDRDNNSGSCPLRGGPDFQ